MVDSTKQIAEGYRRLEQVRDAAKARAYPRRVEMERAVEATAANVGQAAALMDQTDDEDLRRQIAVLESAFRRPGPLPAVRSELNRVKREGLTAMPLLEALSSVYHLHRLDKAPRREEAAPEENDALPRIVCSEAMVEHKEEQ